MDVRGDSVLWRARLLGARGLPSRPWCSRWYTAGTFLIQTLTINVMGSFLMGFLFVETLERLTLAPWIRTGVLTGFLGGYTTFSTFEMETLLLAEGGEVGEGRALCRAFGRAWFGRRIWRSLYREKPLKGGNS